MIDKVKDFKAKNHHGKDLALSDFKGQKIEQKIWEADEFVFKV